MNDRVNEQGITAWIKQNAGPFIVAAMFVVAGAQLVGLKMIVEQGTVIKRLVQQADAREAKDKKNNARLSKQRTQQLDRIDATANLLKDCVGLTEGGPCQARLQAQQRATVKGLIDMLVPSVVEALRKEFGLLRGQLVITVRQDPNGQQMITIEGRNEGGTKSGGTGGSPGGSGKQGDSAKSPVPGGMKAPVPGQTPIREQRCLVDLDAKLVGQPLVRTSPVCAMK